MFYIYVLHSDSSDMYYVGHTDDVQRRLEEHNHSDKTDTFTSKHRPWKLMAVFECSEERSMALKCERVIKKQKSRRLLERIVSGETLTGELAQLVRVPHVRD
jgi:putative endonuclease